MVLLWEVFFWQIIISLFAAHPFAVHLCSAGEAIGLWGIVLACGFRFEFWLQYEVTRETCLQGFLFLAPAWLCVSIEKNVLFLTTLLWWSGCFKTDEKKFFNVCCFSEGFDCTAATGWKLCHVY